VKDNKIR
jgi:hypothetical protein